MSFLRLLLFILLLPAGLRAANVERWGVNNLSIQRPQDVTQFTDYFVCHESNLGITLPGTPRGLPA